MCSISRDPDAPRARHVLGIGSEAWTSSRVGPIFAHKDNYSTSCCGLRTQKFGTVFTIMCKYWLDCEYSARLSFHRARPIILKFGSF